MIKKKKSSSTQAPQLEPAGPGPRAVLSPTERARPALGRRGPHARLRPEEAPGLFVRRLWPPSVFPCVPALPPQLRGSARPATRPGLPEALGQSRERPGRAGPVLGPRQGGPWRRREPCSRCRSPCPSPPPRTDPHTHALSQLVVLFKTGGRPL